MSTAQRPFHMLSLEEAVGAAPTLAALQQRIQASRWCLEQVQHLIPVNLRPHIVAGPLHDHEWCLLVASASASTKLRQLLPSLQQTLIQRGAQVNAIRIKVQTTPR